MRRSEFLRMIALAALLPRPLSGGEVAGAFDFRRCFLDGMATLNDLFWVPEIANWLDRPGKDQRAHFEGRVNPPWWSCANAVETMVDFMDVTRTSAYDAQLSELHTGNVLLGSRLPQLADSLRKQGNWTMEDEKKLKRKMSSLDSGKIHGSEFRNEYLDDSAWWGIAWLKFYERTADERYLRTAVAIHRHMADNWRKDGGVSWADEDGKRDANAITNSLFVVLSARLHRVTGRQDYLEWAQRTLAWQEQTKLYDGTAIVDRPGHVRDYWTYNQGAYLGGLEAMHAATGEAAYLDKAAQVARTILDRSGIVRPDSVLFEKLGRGGWDCSLFKGICARYFGILSRSLKRREIHMDVVARLDSVLHASSVSILKTSKKDGLYPMEWHQPPRSLISNYNTHLSALMAFCAVIEST